MVSFLADLLFGKITSPLPGATEATEHWRVDWTNVTGAEWLGFPGKTAEGLVGNRLEAGNLGAVGWHLPSFSITFSLLVLPAVIALIAENVGHVKAVAEMTGADLDPMMGRAIAADGVGTMIASSVGGSPTTTYAENIGVMAATRSTHGRLLRGRGRRDPAQVRAQVRPDRQRHPRRRARRITLVLYGMIGLLGAKIWMENGVDFAKPVNLVLIAAGIILAIGNAELTITDSFSLSGIALGTLVAVIGYHLANAFAPKDLDEGALTVVAVPG